MRLLFLLSSFFLFFLCFLAFSYGDIRYASSPKETRFRVINRSGSIPFITRIALYMEPSTFGYQGLAIQRMNNYDNFLRSSVDNEQDNRNFNREVGRDMLPFRTLEARTTDATNQLPGPLYIDTGKEYVLPLRLNSAHAYEIELNIWINNNTIVVPIKKPVCGGEGYHDGVISFMVPNDFNDLGSKVFGFNGCTQLGDCVLQLYAHSVEPRAYAVGTPIIINGWNSLKPRATNNSAVQAATRDPGTQLSKLTNGACRSSIDPSSYIYSAVPRFARHVSDVYNHAYQSNNNSPYSGQQHESISKNLQSACILRMVIGNRGQLGQSIVETKAKSVLANLRTLTDRLVKNYEFITNRLINQIFKDAAKTTGRVGGQDLNICFRCAETASLTPNRIESPSYTSSFIIPKNAQVVQARAIIQQINASYANLINEGTRVVQIYTQTLLDVIPFYQQLSVKYGFLYQPAMIKPSPSTMIDPTNFRAINSTGAIDGGIYAAKAAEAARDAGGRVNTEYLYLYQLIQPNPLLFPYGPTLPSIDTLTGDEIVLLE